MSKLSQAQVDTLWNDRTSSYKDECDGNYNGYYFYSKLSGKLYSLYYDCESELITEASTPAQIEAQVKSDLLLVDFKGSEPVETKENI